MSKLREGKFVRTVLFDSSLEVEPYKALGVRSLLCGNYLPCNLKKQCERHEAFARSIAN